MLIVANSVVIGNGDYTDEVQKCTAGSDVPAVVQSELILGPPGVPPAMSAQREQLDHSTVSADMRTYPCGRDARGPSKNGPSEKVDKKHRRR